MGIQNQYSIKLKMDIIEIYLSGEKSVAELAQENNINKATIFSWINKYMAHGEEAFRIKKRNVMYTKALKEAVVSDYRNKVDSLENLCCKYNISSKETLRNWIKKYNGHKELKAYKPKGEVYMTKTRKTTLTERVEIVKYCLNHHRAYKAAAEAYNVSYPQVYIWIKKYDELGEAGLEDRRGKQKPNKDLSELEKLQKENESLRRQLELKERETILLKKVKEFERRRYSIELDKNRNT